MIEYLFKNIFDLTANYGNTIIIISVFLSIVNSFLAKFFLKISANEKYRKKLIDEEILNLPKSISLPEKKAIVEKIKFKYSYNEFNEITHILPLIVQLPLLLAVYYFLIDYDQIIGVPFGPIEDLSKPDKLLFGINLLPILMTILNLFSSESFNRKSILDFIKSSFISILFFILLYNMPSSLLIFWTLNNLFLLIRTKVLNKSIKLSFGFNLISALYHPDKFYVYLIPFFDIINYWSKEPQTFTFGYFLMFFLLMEFIIFLSLLTLKKLKLYSQFSVFFIAIITICFLNFYLYYSVVFDIISNKFLTIIVFLILVIIILLIAYLINLKKITFYKYANVFMITLILIPIFSSILNKRVFSPKVSTSILFPNLDANVNKMLDGDQQSNKRDVVFIILDAYAHKETLAKEYQFDNSNFINFLDSLGFNVFKKTFSNYSITDYSVASVLNMSYIHELNYDGNMNDLSSQLINDNSVGRIFKKLGYDYIHFASEWTGNISSEIASKNINTYLKTIKVSRSLEIYMSKSILPILFDLTISKSEGILKKIKLIEELAINNKKEYIFSHFMIPHPPYVFDSEGAISNYKDSEFFDNIWLDKDSYIGQLKYSNYLIKNLLSNIFKKSDNIPIIILASDHGSFSSYLNSSEINEQIINERMKNFIAIYSSENLLLDQIDIDHTLSPINIFPMIFNEHFKGNFNTIENKSFYSPYTDNNIFTEVTNFLKFNKND